MMRVAVLDDFQDVARRMADWDGLPVGEVVFFRDHLDDPERLIERLEGFDVIVAMRERTPFPRGVVERLPRLRLLVTTGARNSAIDLVATADRGIVVAGTGSSETNAAEMTWALILSLMRRVPDEDRAVRMGRWQHTIGIDLAHKTLGVLGLGRVGSRVARVGLAFDMNVVAWSQNLTPARAAAVGVKWVDKEGLLADADILTIHLVLSPRTRGLIGAAEIGMMKSSAYLINAARSPIVDEAALISALRSSRIAGAALDVYDPEPLPGDHPFRTLPNTVVTPHLGFVTEDAYRVFYGDAVEDIRAFLAGTPVRVLTAPR